MSGRARRAGSSDIRVRVRRSNLEREFTIMPNALVRGDADSIYAGLDPIARLFLMCGLTCQDDWETTLGDIEEWVGGHGRNKNEAIRRQLRETGFLSMQQGRAPNGDFEWQFMFLMTPLAEEERDQLQEKKPRVVAEAPVDDVAEQDATVMPPNPGHHGDHEETAGGTMPRISGPHGSGHRGSGPEIRGDIPSYEKNHLEKNHPPSPSVTSANGDSEQGGAGQNELPSDGAPLGAYLGWFREHNRGWRSDAVKDTLQRAQSERGVTLHQAAVVLAELLDETKHGQTRSPRRALEDGRWWAVLQPPKVPQQRSAAVRCPKHPSEPAGSCPPCLGEAKGARVEEAVPPRPASESPLSERSLTRAAVERGAAATLARVLGRSQASAGAEAGAGVEGAA